MAGGFALAAGAMVVLIALVVYFSNRNAKPEGIGCLGGAGSKLACPDAWSGTTEPPFQMCGSDETVLTGVGPGSCQVTCPAGQVACWSATDKAGTCAPGPECPCEAGGCNHGTCVVGRCICTPGSGYALPDCKTKAAGPCTDNLCAPGGKCAADGVSCECDENRGPPVTSGGVKACSMCAPGRGPGLMPDGSIDCSRRLFTTPLRVMADGCQNYSRSWEGLDADCRGAFGQAAFVDRTAPHGVCGNDVGKTIYGKKCGTDQGRVICVVPRYYASPQFGGNAPLCPAVDPKTGRTPLPPGFAT